MSREFSLDKHVRMVVAVGLQPPPPGCGWPWPTSLGICCVTGKGEGAEGHGAPSSIPHGPICLLPGYPETPKVQGPRLSRPPSCLEEAWSGHSSPAETLIFCLDLGLASGASPPHAVPTKSSALRECQWLSRALTGDLPDQSRWGMGPPSRFPGPPPPCTKAGEGAFQIRRWVGPRGWGWSGSSQPGSLLPGQGQVGLAPSSSSCPVQTCPPGPATLGPSKTPPGPPSAPGGRKRVRSSLRSEAAPWWLPWEHTRG